MLPGSQRRQRREGIYWFNTNIVKSAAKSADVKVESFMSERKTKTKTNSDIRLCTGCKRFISGRNFWRHQCCDQKPTRVNPVAMLREPHTDKDFENNILRRFRNGEPGDICRMNRIIQHVEYRHYCLRKSQTSKVVAVRKSVMQEMRELARLLIKFREIARDQEGLECELGMEEMLSRVHLPILRQAITELAAADSEKDGQEKYDQKIGMGNILTRTIKSMKGMYAEAMEDEKAAELDRFHDAYKFRAHELFASAHHRAVAQSTNKALRPASLLEEVHLEKLKSFIATEIAGVTTGRRVEVEEYVLLRSLVVSRLTLFNGRRGASTDAPK